MAIPDVLDPNDPEHRPLLATWLDLQAALHLAPAQAAAWLAQTRDPAAVLRLAGVRRSRTGRGRGGRDRPDDLEALARLGVRAVPWLSNLYPEGLRRLPDAAPLLLVRGEPGVLLGRAVAIVGARAPTVYGLDVARRLAAALASAGVVVVSGLARGIDAAAHRAALAAGGLTVAFSACGPETTYPAEHAMLAAEIAASGAVVTEMPLGTPPLPQYFPLRNRLISGLSEIVVVVEGRLRSGSLVTARCALEQGREVMAVPGPIGAPTSQGPNRLLRDGAAPLTAVEDVFRALRLPAPPGEAAPATKGADPPAGPDERAVLEALARHPATPDELAARLALAPGRLALALTELELRGRVATDRDGLLRVVGAP